MAVVLSLIFIKTINKLKLIYYLAGNRVTNNRLKIKIVCFNRHYSADCEKLIEANDFCLHL